MRALARSLRWIAGLAVLPLAFGCAGPEREPHDAAIVLPESLREWPVSVDRPRFSPADDRIAFASGDEGSMDLHVADLASGEVTRLLDTSHDDRRPTWSPDGRRLAFQSDRGGSFGLWVVELEDLSVRRLTSGDWVQAAPHWSPRGDWITYVSNEHGSWDVWVIRPDGSDAHAVTEHPGNEYHPKFSSDGTEIVFYPTWSNWTDIYVVTLETGEVREVLAGEHEDYRPAFDPSGRRIVFASDREDSSGLWIVDASGGEPVRLVASAAGLDYPDWSRDGSTILYLEDAHFSAIREARIGDGSTTSLIGERDPAMDRRPAVSRDGEWLAYETDRLGNEGNVVLREIETGVERRISAGRINDGHPRFSPDGSELVFVRSGGDQASGEAIVVSVSGGEAEAWTDMGNVNFPSFCGADRIVFAWAEVAYTTPLELWSMRRGEEPVRLGEDAVERSGVACDPDGRWLVASLHQPPGGDEATPRLARIDLGSGTVTVLTEDTIAHRQPRLSPDGRSVAYVRGSEFSGELFVVPVEGGEPRSVLGADHPVGAADWLDDERLAYSAVNKKASARIVRVPDET